jgi:hypothetical protein
MGYTTNSIEKNQDEPYEILEYHIFRQIQMFIFMCRLKNSCDFVAMDVGGGPIICFSCRALHSEGECSWKENHFVVAMPQCP